MVGLTSWLALDVPSLTSKAEHTGGPPHPPSVYLGSLSAQAGVISTVTMEPSPQPLTWQASQAQITLVCIINKPQGLKESCWLGDHQA